MDDISNIKQCIYNNQRQIELYEDEITQLYKDIARLEELYHALSQRKKQFNEIQQQNLEKAFIISKLDINKKITSSYSDGMRKYLSGNDYQNAQEGLDIAMRRTNDKITELQEVIRQKSLQIDNLHGIISNMQYELHRAMHD